MEQEPQKKKVGIPAFGIHWHPDIKDDLEDIHPSTATSIVRAAEHRLSRAPLFIGQPLKGTARLLWKIRFGKYRILYTVNTNANEVWILAVQKRDIVYKHKHVESLLKLAVALQKQFEQDT